MKSILKQIIKAKKAEIALLKKKIPLAVLKVKAGLKIKNAEDQPRDFLSAIGKPKKINCIGELKIASPSKGYLRKNLDLVKTALLYQDSGIAAISVLTDKHFKGKLTDLKKVKAAVRIPVLRKDFLIDIYQVYEAYLAGADAVLLIAAILSAKQLKLMLDLAHGLKMNAIVEVHDLQDIEKLDMRQARIVGINNRNLNTFALDLKTTECLIKKIPKTKIVISESGIFNRSDMVYLKKQGVNCVLIGEGIVTAADMGLQIKTLLGKRK
ncbi:MAG: indole-3-glycerol phosphate synthase TrpC [Candidatus Omnitrophica bacterium]|nr:indole-3-glycerol phosphate synthase TrpC [Candidatus Omnitrophota bacterium]